MDFGIAGESSQYQELLFAAEVRKLAVKLGNSELNKYLNSIEKDEDRDAKLDEWRDTHGVESYLEKAYRQLVEAAKEGSPANQAGRSERTHIGPLQTGQAADSRFARLIINSAGKATPWGSGLRPAPA